MQKLKQIYFGFYLNIFNEKFLAKINTPIKKNLQRLYSPYSYQNS